MFELEPAKHLGSVGEEQFVALHDFFGWRVVSSRYRFDDSGLIALRNERTDFEAIPNSVIKPFFCAANGWLIKDADVLVTYSVTSVEPGYQVKAQPWHFDDFGKRVRAVVFSNAVPTLVANGALSGILAYLGDGTDNESELPMIYDDERLDLAVRDSSIPGIWLQDKPDDYVVSTGETHAVREFCELAFARADLDYKKAYTLQFVNKGVGLDLKKKLTGG